MKAGLTTLAAVALAAAFAAPAQAQQADEGLAARHDAGSGQCAISQAMLAAIEQNKQAHLEATKTRIDRLIEGALAATRATRSAGAGTSPVIMGKRPDSG